MKILKFACSSSAKLKATRSGNTKKLMIKHFMLLKSVRFSTIINNVHIVKKKCQKRRVETFQYNFAKAYTKDLDQYIFKLLDLDQCFPQISNLDLHYFRGVQGLTTVIHTFEQGNILLTIHTG